MGFGHAVYRTEDPRSLMLRDIARDIGGDLVEFATTVEQRVVAILAELKPGRQLYANVEFYAGVVMELCGIPRAMFTPTFAVEQGGRLVRQHPGAGGGRQDHPPVRPLRRPDAATAGAGRVILERHGPVIGRAG